MVKAATLSSKCCCPNGCDANGPIPGGGDDGGISLGSVLLIM